jgi:ABC-2 type transport system ATP-binding protein
MIESAAQRCELEVTMTTTNPVTEAVPAGAQQMPEVVKPDPTTPAIEARGLTKIFTRGRQTVLDRIRRRPDRRERFAAVDCIDLSVAAGEIFGVLGPNGAGKTTTLRMLATLLEPTSGEARVLGLDVVRQAREVRRTIGTVLSGDRSVYWKLTARENLQYFAALYHVPPGLTRSRIQDALAMVELTDRADDYVERFSTGMRQRLVLARALVPDPALLMVDEPTVGLDPQAAAHIRERISTLRDQGRTILLTTHYMEEADQLCDRLAIIDHGTIVALGTPAELKRRIRVDQVVHLRVETAASGTDGRFMERIRARAEVVHDERSDGVLQLTVHCPAAPEFVTEAFTIAREMGTPIDHVEIVPVSLEEVFLTLTGRALRP